MKTVTKRWRFRTNQPMPFKLAIQRLQPAGLAWFERDADYREDSMTARLTDRARVDVVGITIRAFKVKLRVEAETDEQLQLELAEGAKKLLDEVFPLLDAQDITELAAEP